MSLILVRGAGVVIRCHVVTTLLRRQGERVIWSQYVAATSLQCLVVSRWYTSLSLKLHTMLSDIRNITATRWLQAFCVKYDLSKSRTAARSQRYLVMECRTPVTIAHTGYRKDDMSDKE